MDETKQIVKLFERIAAAVEFLACQQGHVVAVEPAAPATEGAEQESTGQTKENSASE